MRRTLGLVAHDEKKADLVSWVSDHRDWVRAHRIFATGTTGTCLKQAQPDLSITCLKSGPLGGDQQLGAMIAEGKLDLLIFFVDPLSPHPHDVDVKALIRLATLQDIPFACNKATADLFVSGGI